MQIQKKTQQQDTTTNKNDTNQNDEDSSDESMESESGLFKPDTNKSNILTKNESENEAQHQIITKLANTKKNNYKILQQKDIALASTYCLTYLWKVVKITPYQILMEGINMTMERGLNMKDQNHPRYNDYFHDCKHIVQQSIAYRRSYATKQMKNKLKSKFFDMQHLSYL